MKKLLIGLGLLALSATASADFFGSNNDGEWKMGPYGPYWDESDWPKWTPMYWMEEMTDSFDNNNNGFNGFGGMPFMGGYNNAMPYPGMMPGGYAMPPMGMPMNGGYAMPPMGYGAPMMPAAPMPAPVMPAPTFGTPGPSAAPVTNP